MSVPFPARAAVLRAVWSLVFLAAAGPAAGTLAIREALCDPPLLDPGGAGTLRVTLVNDGPATVDVTDLHWNLDCPLLETDALAAPSGPLRSGESAVFAWTLIPGDDSGVARLSVSLTGPGGQRAGSFVLLRVGRGEIWISEIQYDPSAGDGEWIELVSVAGATIDLAGWQVQDATRRATTIGPGAVTLGPGDVALVAESPAGLRAAWPELRTDAILPRSGSWPSLNNSYDGDQGYADQIVLLDAGDVPVDYVRYIPGDLDGDGVSLERWIDGDRMIDPTALAPCPASRGSTPGFTDGMPAGSRDDAGGVALDPNPFFADRADGPQLCRISLPHAFAGAQQVTADIFSIAGERVATLVAGARVSGPVILAWNGCRADGRSLPTGLYVVRAVLRSPASGRTRTRLQSVALVHE
jgi:hypothetical protein